ncbi:MAG: hypothetical protein CBCREVIR_1359 [Candidatus Burkholderia crenata]|nr:MAG: hypothetical protein CBCREVIR_1359 [Candidatus Burkholderia crenata]
MRRNSTEQSGSGTQLNYDGVIVTIVDFDVLKGAISKVTAKHIPLITINFRHRGATRPARRDHARRTT